MDTNSLYPTAQPERLESFIGKDLSELPTPFAVIDRGIAAENCRRMLEACKQAKVQFRAHIKTHKCIQLAEMQQEGQDELHYLVSTVAEAEFMKNHLLKAVAQNPHRIASILYGFPVAPSLIERLACLAKELGRVGIILLIDNLAHVQLLQKFKDIAGFGPHIMFKADVGYHRAGIAPTDNDLGELAEAAIQAERKGLCTVYGLYTHSGHSYQGSSPEDGLQYLLEEVRESIKAGEIVKARFEKGEERHLVYSMGASPSATAIQNVFGTKTENSLSTSQPVQELRKLLGNEKDTGYTFELHAGVYAVMDIQQMNIQSTQSGSATQAGTPITLKDIALSVIAEVASVYPKRDPPEALIAAGTLTFGREPCPGYSGWGLVSGWGMDSDPLATLKPSGWEIFQISQEHGLLRKSKDSRVKTIANSDGSLDLQETMPFRIGQKVRIWPNHACVAANGFGCYAVVDSKSSAPNKVVDVWVRCRGW